MSWHDAVAFCNAASQHEGLPPFYAINGPSVEVLDWNGPGYRLQTEAEWEYACRVESRTWYCYDDEEKRLAEHAWYSANSGYTTHPVGQKRANNFGLKDMHGNVYEWCRDWFDVAYYKQSRVGELVLDPRAPGQARFRVYRGGTWFDLSFQLRSAYRFRDEPEYQSEFVGFRLARFQARG